jgi:hypothetical protein
MKSILPISVAALALFASSCSKEIVIPVQPLQGSWVLVQASQNDGHSWQSFYTGLESGVFYFYSDGSAAYDDGHLNLNGSWFSSTSSSGYYDEYGNYYTDLHQTLEVHLQDYYSNSSVNMVFDDIKLYGDRFVATNYNNGVVERYAFSRY